MKKHQKGDNDNVVNESGDHTLIIDEDEFFFDETEEKSNEPVNDDTFFDYDNLDENGYDFSEEDVLKKE